MVVAMAAMAVTAAGWWWWWYVVVVHGTLHNYITVRERYRRDANIMRKGGLHDVKNVVFGD
jgi:hypothetical protein